MSVQQSLHRGHIVIKPTEQDKKRFASYSHQLALQQDETIKVVWPTGDVGDHHDAGVSAWRVALARVPIKTYCRPYCPSGGISNSTQPQPGCSS
jgi:hypothetical protein